MKGNNSKLLKCLLAIAKCLACLVCVAVTIVGMRSILLVQKAEKSTKVVVPSDYMVMDRYDQYFADCVVGARETIVSVKKSFWLNDNEPAPKPNQACYGETSDPKQMQAILDQAKELLEGQEMVFSTDVELCPGSVIRYYYDPTILAISWQVVMDNSVYSISEIKVADSSQFRRYFADDRFGAGSRYMATKMASMVNAVVAANGDYYNVRMIGTVVYNSQLMRMEGHRMDTCYIDGNGDLNFLRAGEITSREEMEQYLQERQVRFNLAFGPIMVDNGELVNFRSPYCVGEVDSPNARAALCQKGSLHYLVVMVGAPPPYTNVPVLSRFAQRLQEMGVDKAYNIDGGRSGVLVMNNERINYVYERELSDIIYFATAYPTGE